jgi:hypothetical protein
MSSPTARSLELLRELGYTAKVVEHWNQYAKIRQDLFGVDILALKPGEPVLVYRPRPAATTQPGARSWTEQASPHCGRAAGAMIEAWSWAKQGQRGQRKVWTVRYTV